MGDGKARLDMNLEYQSVPNERRKDFYDLLHYAFRLEEGHAEFDPEAIPGEVGARRGLFDGEELAVVCRHYWFDARVRGTWLPAPGLSAVASPPEHRHKGYIRQLLEESLREYRERGSVLSLLWPFKYSFYHKYGWDTCSRFSRIGVEPGHLAFTADTVEGEFRRASADDWKALDDIYTVDAGDEDLALERTENWWRHRIFEGWDKDPFVYLWETDDEPRGYVVYTVEDDTEEDGKTLDIREVAAVEESAYRNGLRFAYSHEAQVERVRIHGSPEATLLDRLPQQWDAECKLSRGPMARIVDVPIAIEALDYPPDLNGSVRIGVDDPLVDWNDNTFEVSFANGSSSCLQVNGDPDVAFSMAALSQLYVGYRSLERLRRETAVTVYDEDAANLLDRAFPSRKGYLREGF